MKYLSPEQIAERLRVSRSTAYRIARDIAGSAKVEEGDLERYIAARSILPEGGRPNAIKHPLPELLGNEVVAAFERFGRCCEYTGWTYLIEGAGLIKIGKSDAAVTSRIVTIQSCSPIPLKVVALGRDSTLERRLHVKFGRHRRHGEWFDAPEVRGALFDAWQKMQHTRVCLRCALEQP